MSSEKMIGLIFNELQTQISEYLRLREELARKRAEHTLTGKRIALIQETTKKAEDRGLFVQDSELLCR
jgi:hypothetical protein